MSIFAVEKRKDMKQTYKIEVDRANCANLVEEAVKKVPGVKDACVVFMTQKMKVEFEDWALVSVAGVSLFFLL